ncbi:MAG: O-antigen ligase C-terminal domain-containing protein, partial [Betaproteobacteria bacterium]|nr:O-antigen ligase C-terminal domain-containing protein [Betaproteobacteria bacterium]
MKVPDNERAAQLSLILTGLMFVVPFLQPYHRFPLTAFYSEWLAFALGLAAAALLLRREPWRGAALPAVALVPPVLALLLGLQVALGRVPYPEQALTAALYLLWAALLMLLAHTLRRELGMTAVVTTLAWFALCGGLLGALAGLLQHYQLSTPLDFLVVRKGGAGVYGNLGQANHYAAYVTLALGCAAYLYGRGRMHGAWVAAWAAPLLFVLALSGSRSPWLYLAVLAALALVLRRHRREADSRRLAVFVLWLLPGFVAAQWVAALPFMIPEQTAQVTSGERLFAEAAGIEARWQLWHEAWRMFLAAPVLGAGYGQFAWNHFEYTATEGMGAAPGIFNHAHNIVFHLLAETGCIGALIVTGAALVWLADLRHARLDLDRWWILALLAVIGIHSLLEFPLWYAYFLGVAALLLGLGAER